MQKTLNDWGWLYVCRTGKNIKIFLDGREYDLPVISFLLLPGLYMHVRAVLFTHHQYGPVMVLAWWAEKNEELIYESVDLVSF